MLLESFVSLSAQGIIQRGRQRTLLCPSRMPTGLHNMCIPGLIVTLWPLGLQNSYNSFTICHNKAEALFIHYFPHSLCPSIFSFRPSFTAWKQSSFQAAHIFWQASCFLPPQVLPPYSASFSFFLHCFCFWLRILCTYTLTILGLTEIKRDRSQISFFLTQIFCFLI